MSERQTQQGYRIAQFAKLAGVTVRTLHYYDQTGLLTPAHSTEAGYRLYTRDDLLRLQQILTLKWMGFPLSRIKAMLDDPGFDLREALMRQQAAVEAQIARLQAASTALGRAVALVGGSDDLDTATITAIIQGMTQPDEGEVMRRYYSEDAWAGINARRMNLSPAQMEQAQRDWQAVYAGFAALGDADPAGPEAQALAEKMHTLIEAFTGGDPEAEAGMRRFNADAQAGTLPDDYSGTSPYPVDATLHHLMQTAYSIYRDKRKGKSS